MIGYQLFHILLFIVAVKTGWQIFSLFDNACFIARHTRKQIEAEKKRERAVIPANRASKPYLVNPHK